jgi:hypothetical protein
MKLGRSCSQLLQLLCATRDDEPFRHILHSGQHGMIRDLAYSALFAGLHAWRDAVERDDALRFGLACPSYCLRGSYFEGWHRGTPTRTRGVAHRARRHFFHNSHD